MTIQLAGFDDLDRALGNLARGIAARLETLPDTIAHQIAEDARQNAPRDTGALQASIHVAGPQDDGANAVAVLAGGTDAPHAAAIEFGTSDQPAQPFLRPAIERAQRDGDRILAAALGGLL